MRLRRPDYSAAEAAGRGHPLDAILQWSSDLLTLDLGPSMRLAWMTDLHLNCVRPDVSRAFCEHVLNAAPDGIIISGDIGEAVDVDTWLTALEKEWARPIYFVLGNHDFYHGSIRAVRGLVTDLVKGSKFLRYLSIENVFELSPDTGLLGHDGWSDARLGDYENSTVTLNDYYLIKELAGLDPATRGQRLNILGDEAAASVLQRLPEALKRFKKIIFVTHVPPFREACTYRGKPSDDNWLPHFSCQAIGDVLLEFMRANPTRQMTVLCGHTHGGSQCQILPNLEVITGEAEYGAPVIQKMIDV